MKILIHGDGVMGKRVHNIYQGFSSICKDSKELEKELSKSDYDVLIDFSHPSLIDEVCNIIEKFNIKAVIATTGLSDSQLKRIESLSKETAIFQSYNTAYGVHVLNETIKFMNGMLKDYDVEMIETHHNKKVDAPSGTLNLLLNSIVGSKTQVTDYSITSGRNKEDIGIHSIRLGQIFGEHEVLFAQNEEVISIKHQALSKDVFAKGSIRAAKSLLNKNSGLYNLQNIYEEKI